MTINAYSRDWSETPSCDDCRAVAETNKMEALKMAFRAGFEYARDLSAETVERAVKEIEGRT